MARHSASESTARETLSRDINEIRNMYCRVLLILQCFHRGLPTCAIHFVGTLLDEIDGWRRSLARALLQQCAACAPTGKAEHSLSNIGVARDGWLVALWAPRDACHILSCDTSRFQLVVWHVDSATWSASSLPHFEGGVLPRVLPRLSRQRPHH